MTTSGTKGMRELLLVAAIVLGQHGRAPGASVLFVGNSYIGFNNLPGMFAELAASLGHPVTTGVQAPGGYTLIQHSTNASTLNAIASQPWDFVVLQEQSQLGALPPDYDGTAMGAAVLADSVRAARECARPVFYMTWGRQDGDAQFCPSFPNMCTYADMQQALRDNYLALAGDNDAYTAPVGMAWKRVRDDHPGIPLYQNDGSHPTVYGTYLAACVFYCTLFQQPCAGASFTSTLPPDTAALLQGIASTTVLDSLATWNLDLPNGISAAITGSTSGAWNSITFQHPGTGTHLWTCSDGQTSSAAEPTFTVTEPGTYAFAHTYTDPCGNTDTATWTETFIGTGVADNGLPAGIRVTAATGTLTLHGGTFREVLTLLDTAGRTLATAVHGAGTLTLPCSSGVRIWTLLRTDGERYTGRVLIP